MKVRSIGSGGFREGSGRKKMPPTKQKRIPVDSEQLIVDLLNLYHSINAEYRTDLDLDALKRFSLFLGTVILLNGADLHD